MNPVPAVVLFTPASSMTAPKTRSPLAVVVAAVLVMAFDVVEPFAMFFATTSSGPVSAMPRYS